MTLTAAEASALEEIIMAIDLDDLDYNDRYDATIAKGLCFECGGKVEPYWCEPLSEWFTPIWCASCKIGISIDDCDQQSLDISH